MDLLVELGMARELTGKRRNRLFVYDRYLAVLNKGPRRLEPKISERETPGLAHNPDVSYDPCATAMTNKEPMPPALLAYPREAGVAEKVEAMVRIGSIAHRKYKLPFQWLAAGTRLIGLGICRRQATPARPSACRSASRPRFRPSDGLAGTLLPPPAVFPDRRHPCRAADGTAQTKSSWGHPVSSNSPRCGGARHGGRSGASGSATFASR